MKTMIKRMFVLFLFSILVSNCAPSEKRRVWEISRISKDKELVAIEILEKLPFLEKGLATNDSIFLGGLSPENRTIGVEVRSDLIIIREPIAGGLDHAEEVETANIIREIRNILEKNGSSILIKKYRPWTIFG